MEYKSQPRKQFGPARRAITVLSGKYASEADYNDDDSDGHGDNHDICDPNYTQNSGRGCFSQVEQEEQWKKGRFIFNS